jgi:cutinase
MGWIIGNYLTPTLQKANIAVQGVKYDAGILTNIIPGMADPAAVKEAQRLFKLSLSKCPNAVVTGGGYSQGAAIMHRTIEGLDAATKDKIAAILLYGDTQYPSDGNSIKGFPKEKVKVICKQDDGVCFGYITVTPGHLSYSSTAAEGANWIVQKVKEAKKDGGASTHTEGGGEEAGAPAPAPAPEPKMAKMPGGKGGGGKGFGGKGGKTTMLKIDDKLTLPIDDRLVDIVVPELVDVAEDAAH